MLSVLVLDVVAVHVLHPNPAHPLWELFAYTLVAVAAITSIKRLHDLGYGAIAVVFLGPIVPLLLFMPGERNANAYGDPIETRPSVPPPIPASK